MRVMRYKQKSVSPDHLWSDNPRRILIPGVNGAHVLSSAHPLIRYRCQECRTFICFCPSLSGSSPLLHLCLWLWTNSLLFQIKWYKSCHWGGSLSDGTNMHTLSTKFLPLGTNMYIWGSNMHPLRKVQWCTWNCSTPVTAFEPFFLKVCHLNSVISRREPRTCFRTITATQNMIDI